MDLEKPSLNINREQVDIIKKKKNPIKLIILIVVIIVVIAGLVALILHFTKSSAGSTSKKNAGASSTSSAQSNPNSIRLIATGDWIAHTSVDTAAQQADGTYNFIPQVKDIMPIFKTGDIRFCNDPILNGGESLGISGYPKFNSPTEFATDMGQFGCNLVNTASNHSFDYTQANINNSVDAWAKVPNTLAVVGENKSQSQHDAVNTFTVKGVKIAFLAYTTYSNTDAPALNNYGVNIFSTSLAGSQIQQARADGAKFIIVSMRWGTEYSTSVNSEQTSDANYLASQGVNLVIGHGSHELQPVQQIKGTGSNGTLVWYSIGNFLNSQEPPETLFNGLPIMDIDTKTLAITNVRFLPTYMHYEWTASQQAADDINARTNLHMYLLENTTQSMIDAQQLHTTVNDQKQRIQTTLNADGLSIPLITSSQL
jgi:poly-gamma-glutamate synthesis protein (capsule biosynthesis protein)